MMKKELVCSLLAGCSLCATAAEKVVESKILPKVYLWQDSSIRTHVDRPSITPMLVNSSEARPAVLVIPGGGYGSVCESTEGSPIGKKFNELGYHAFVLDYRTGTGVWPRPQLDAMRAMKMIRCNAKKWNVNPDRVYVCGFSAGGHLAASLGTICAELDAAASDECDKFPHRPDAMILCYGVLVFEDWSHIGTQRNLLGDDFKKVRHNCSTEKFVNADTPPAFLMHTINDQTVNYRNSIVFAEAMAKAQVPCELALYNWGDHGMLLGKNTEVGAWPLQAYAFLETLEKSKLDPGFRERYTNKYQAGQL
ncbi:MAG: alpha/beta hydrolase [Lentisphaerae bacterium]|nr:alpha/beta hydrolase [Lentisphaerota bacterium]